MTMRRERKYTFGQNRIQEVRDELKNSKFAFSEVYQKRFVNSLYMDSNDFLNYDENLAGLSKRSKARIRWYSQTKFTKSKTEIEAWFELKSRNNQIGEKLTKKFKIPSSLLMCDRGLLINFLYEVLPFEILRYIDHCSLFTLGVTYQREYFQDFYNQLRITLDSNISYFEPKEGKYFFPEKADLYDMEYCILELKHPLEFEENIYNTTLDVIEVSSGRHSKYSVGLYTLYK